MKSRILAWTLLRGSIFLIENSEKCCLSRFTLTENQHFILIFFSSDVLFKGKMLLYIIDIVSLVIKCYQWFHLTSTQKRNFNINLFASDIWVRIKRYYISLISFFLGMITFEMATTYNWQVCTSYSGNNLLFAPFRQQGSRKKPSIDVLN